MDVVLEPFLVPLVDHKFPTDEQIHVHQEEYEEKGCKAECQNVNLDGAADRTIRYFNKAIIFVDVEHFDIGHHVSRGLSDNHSDIEMIHID